MCCRGKNVSRHTLAEHTGLSLMSVKNLVEQLNDREMLCASTQRKPPTASGKKQASAPPSKKRAKPCEGFFRRARSRKEAYPADTPTGERRSLAEKDPQGLRVSCLVEH